MGLEGAEGIGQAGWTMMVALCIPVIIRRNYNIDSTKVNAEIWRLREWTTICLRFLPGVQFRAERVNDIAIASFCLRTRRVPNLDYFT